MGFLDERILILGTSPLARKIAKLIGDHPSGYRVVGFVDGAHNNGGFVPHNGAAIPGDGATSELHKGLPHPIIRTLDRLENAIKELRPHRIIVSLTENGSLPVQDLLNSRIAGVQVEDTIEAYERLAHKLAIESLPPTALIFSKDLEKPWLQLALRRAFSLAFATVGLLLTAPLMVAIALAINLDSKGPVFFIQQREGYRGRIFRMLKFRTMHPASGEEAGWQRNLCSRTTRVGKWLRQCHLDELPQFINVIRGDMDIVGPRPEMACNVKTMCDEIPYYSFRTMIRPGMTGWAQVNNGYALRKEEVTEKIRYDLYYIKHMSLWFDLRILLHTLKILFIGRGSEATEG